MVRSAEEAASMLATSISPDQCIKVLCPIIQTADYPINLAAIKMQTKVIERVSKETLTQLLPEIVPGLIQVRRKKRGWRGNTNKNKTKHPVCIRIAKTLKKIVSLVCHEGFCLSNSWWLLFNKINQVVGTNYLSGRLWSDSKEIWIGCKVLVVVKLGRYF